MLESTGSAGRSLAKDGVLSRYTRLQILVASFGLLIVLGLSVALGNRVMASTTTVTQYCVEGTHTYETGCFPTQREAEVFMRQNTPMYADVLKQGNSVVYDNGKTRINYRVEDQPPRTFYEPVYLIGGSPDMTRAFCEGNLAYNDPYFSGRYCLSEAPLISNFIATYLQNNENCTYSNIQVTGAYVAPYSTISSSWENGFLVNDTPDWASRRKIEYDTFCWVWGTNEPTHHEVGLSKSQSFTCKAGYRAPTMNWPIHFPNLCGPTYWMPYILTSTKQCQSCDSTNGNPTVAATGNKEYREQDFEWEGLAFSRYYNSIRDQIQGAGFGGNWSHTFDESIDLTFASNPVLKRYDGYLQRFVTADSVIFRPQFSRDGTLIRDKNAAGETIAWRLIRGQETRTFEAAGRLVQVESGGRKYQLTYCSSVDAESGACGRSGELSAVSSDRGRVLYFSRNLLAQDGPFRGSGDGATVISRISSDGGTLVDYAFSAAGSLAGVTYPGSTTPTTYLYGESDHVCRTADGASEPNCSPAHFPFHLTGVIDSTSTRYATYRYDHHGRVVSSEHAGGAGSVKLIYNADSTAEVILPLGARIRYAFGGDVVTRVSSATVQGIGSPTATTGYVYGSDGRLSTRTDPNGFRTTFSYDALHETKRVEGLTSASETTPSTRTIESDWHPQLQQPAQRRTYNATNALLTKSNWTYNTRGQVLTQTQTDPVTSTTRTTTTAYCEQSDINAGTCPLLGLTKSIDGPRTDVTDVTTYTYRMADDASCATSPTTCPYRKGDLWKVTNALGHVTETLKYDGAGRVLSVKDANAVVTDMEYHPRGWLTARKVRGANLVGEASDQITRVEYWPTGLVKKVTQPDGAFTSYTYDAAHRLTDITDASGNTIHYTLDNAGNKTQEDTKDAQGALKRTLSRVYNQLGQLQTQKDAAQHPTGFAYDPNGNLDIVTDALTRVTDNDYDPLNRLKRTLQDVGGIEAETKFDYDALDHLTKVTDPKGLDTHYIYNGLGDLTQLRSPDTGTTDYLYDSAGNRTTQTDAREIVTTYTYDALNRLQTISYSDGSAGITYAYDAANKSQCSLMGVPWQLARGRLTKITDASGSTDYCYDRFGHLTGKKQLAGSVAYIVSYAYTLAGQLTQVTYPNNLIVDYVRDMQGRTTEVGVKPAGGARQILLHQITYHPFGPVASWTYGNGRTLQRTLNQDYQPLAIADASPGGLSLGYEFNAVGNLTKLHNADQSALLARYDYDALNRLTEVKDGPTGTPIEQYGYDATGNRTSLTTSAGATPYVYPATSHRLDSVGATARTYDNVGNTTTIGGPAKEFVYGGNNRMAQVKQNGVATMTYAYNGKGEQVRRTAGTTSTHTVYDETGHWLGDYTSSSTALQNAIWLDDLPVGLMANNQLHYVEPDHLGTPRVVIDPVRNVAVWTWELKGEAFGNTVPNQDPDANGTTFVFNMRFAGQRYDAASGLNYNMRRDYSPGEGRYVQSDPIGLAGGISTYSYVAANPLMDIDPSGLFSMYAYQLFSGEWRFRFRFHQSCVLGNSPLDHADNAFQYLPWLGKIRKRQVNLERPTGDVDAADKCACRAFDSNLEALFTANGWQTGDRYGGQGYSESQATQMLSAMRQQINQLNKNGGQACEKCEMPWESLITRSKARGVPYIGNSAY